jgi:AraC-like DNA-binding protein
VRYEELAPPAELRDLVHRIWLLRGAPARGRAPFQRVMPDGRAELIFNLADPFECRDGAGTRLQPLALLVGPNRRAMEIRATGAVDLVGVRFRPEALSAWLRVRGGELLDRSSALGELPALLDRTLAEQLAEARGSGPRLDILRSHLAQVASRVAFDRRIGAAVDLALADSRARPAVIAGVVGLSPRQLSRLFQQRLGFGLKPLIRLGRFQRALRALEGPGRPSVAATAVRAGYFDQAHLARDFRLFAGIAPGRYLQEARELTRNFIADLDSAPASCYPGRSQGSSPGGSDNPRRDPRCAHDTG